MALGLLIVIQQWEYDYMAELNQAQPLPPSQHCSAFHQYVILLPFVLAPSNKRAEGKWELATATSTSASHQQVSGISWKNTWYSLVKHHLCTNPFGGAHSISNPLQTGTLVSCCAKMPAMAVLVPSLLQANWWLWLHWAKDSPSFCRQECPLQSSSSKRDSWVTSWCSTWQSDLSLNTILYHTSFSHIVHVVTCCKSVLLHSCHKNCIYLLYLHLSAKAWWHGQETQVQIYSVFQ